MKKIIVICWDIFDEYNMYIDLYGLSTCHGS